MTRVDLPYVQITQVNELLKRLPPAFLAKEKIDYVELSKAIGVKKSTVSNMITTMKSLKLVEGRGKYHFTDKGKEYASYLIRDSEDKAREVLEGIVNSDFSPSVKSRICGFASGPVDAFVLYFYQFGAVPKW